MKRVLLLAIVLIAGLLPPQAAARERCFPGVPGVGACIDERFSSYWETHGGLGVFGYPLSSAHYEETTEGRFWVQYFERQRFEWHPENPRPYDVLLGRIGDERLRGSGRRWQDFPAEPGDPINFPSSGVGCRRFAETGFSVCEPFISAWRAQGLESDGLHGYSDAERLALWGYPISPPLWETNSSGDRIITQWFERARFEWHEQHRGTPYEVLKGRLGAELRSERARPDGSLVRGERLWTYRNGRLTPWIARGINYNPSWAPWELWEQWDRAKVAADLDRIAAMGANVLRVPLPWRNFRRSAPGSAAARSAFAQFIALASARNLKVIPILFDEYCKYGKPDGGCWDSWVWNEETAELAEALPRQHRNNPTIALWEITNEPAWVNSSEWTWQSRHRESRLGWLRAAATAIRQAAPYQPIMVGVSLPHEARDIVASGAGEIISLHYYPEIHRDRPPLAEEVADLAAIQLPIIIGEAGASSSPQFSGSERNQARFLCATLQTAGRYRAGLLWWHLQAWDDQGWESQLGLFRDNGSPKPAALIFAGQQDCTEQRHQPR